QRTVLRRVARHSCGFATTCQGRSVALAGAGHAPQDGGLKAAPALSDTNLYPRRRPVCVGFSKDSHYMLATLFNGELAVVDLQAWNVMKSWGKNDIAENGCGFAASPSGTNCTARPAITRRHGCTCSTLLGNPSSWHRIISQSQGRTRTGSPWIRPARRCGSRTTTPAAPDPECLRAAQGAAAASPKRRGA